MAFGATASGRWRRARAQRAGGWPLAPARPEEQPRGAVIGEVLVTTDNASHVLAAWGRHRRAAPRAEPPHVRARLLGALAWAAGAFAVLAVLSSELARVLGLSLAGLGVSAAALCALLAGVQAQGEGDQAGVQ